MTKACRNCAAKIGRSNKTGLCRPCAMVAQYRPAPDDLAEWSHESYADMSARWNAGAETIRRWIKEAGIKRVDVVRTSMRMTLPDHYLKMRAGLSIDDAARRFTCGRDKIKDWDHEVGYVIPRRSRAKAAAGAHVLPGFREALGMQRDMSRVGQAASFMAKDRPVYRCNERGGPDPRGVRWRCGSAVLSDAELIERASYKGWVPVGVAA